VEVAFRLDFIGGVWVGRWFGFWRDPLSFEKIYCKFEVEIFEADFWDSKSSKLVIKLDIL
jgi:hypothetical protein